MPHQSTYSSAIVVALEKANPHEAGGAGRIAFLNAIAHVELNAIDLALDMACRFVGQNLPKVFYNDWLGVADDRSQHF